MFARTKYALIAIGLGAVAFAQIAPAQAVPMLRLTDDVGNTVTITDGGAGDINPMGGAVTYLGSLGDWSLNVTTGLSKPVMGSVGHPHLDLSSVNVTSGVAGTLTIEFTDTDFDIASAMNYINQVGGTTSGTVSYTAFLDSGNAAFTRSTSLGTLGVYSGAFSGSGSPLGTISVPGSFSITQVVTITHTEASSGTSLDAEIEVPEPAALAVLGFGLVMLGFARTRRQRASAA